MSSYVAFSKGTKANYQALVTANKVNDDTLYFVFESATSDSGTLYLGQKQITSDVTISSLDSIEGVSITSIADNDVLVYDSTSSKWKNDSFSDLVIEALEGRTDYSAAAADHVATTGINVLTVQVPVVSWVAQSDGTYTQSCDVSGLNSGVPPLLALKTGSQQDYDLIDSAETTTTGIVFTASIKPSADIVLTLM